MGTKHVFYFKPLYHWAHKNTRFCISLPRRYTLNVIVNCYHQFYKLQVLSFFLCVVKNTPVYVLFKFLTWSLLLFFFSNHRFRYLHVLEKMHNFFVNVFKKSAINLWIINCFDLICNKCRTRGKNVGVHKWKLLSLVMKSIYQSF